jgi:hypothetical protein
MLIKILFLPDKNCELLNKVIFNVSSIIQMLNFLFDTLDYFMGLFDVIL